MSNITNEITLLFKTRLDEKSKTEIGKNLKGLLENAVITFDEAEIKKSLQPIVQMMKMMFDKAGMAFDADKLLGMPSKQALQSMANLSIKDLQMAYDKAVANSGGINIDFGNMDLSALSSTLNGIAADVEAVNQKMANSTKKSTSEIEASINRLKPSTKVMVDGVEQAGGKLEKTVSSIEKTLERVNKPSHIYNENSATKALETAQEKYMNSVTKNDPWEVQYQHMLSFVSKYEAMSQKIKPIIDTNRPEFKNLYDTLLPKAGAAKISLEHFVDIARGNEFSEYKNQPWARESTLKNIEQVLKSGISVKGGTSDGPESTDPPNQEDGDGNDNKNKSPNPKEPASKDPNIALDEQARIEAEKKAQAEKAAAEAAEKRRIAEEKIAATVKKITVYRGLIPPEETSLTRKEILNNGDGSEWWSSNKNAAQTYADMDEGGTILKGTIVPKNPLVIDAGGRNFDEFQKMPGIKNIVDQFPKLTQLINSKADIMDIQKYINTRAAELGHDVVQFDNVNDVLNPSLFKELGSTFAVLNDNVLKVNGAFKMLSYDEQESMGDYSEKASKKDIPEYYQMPEVTENDVAVHQNNTAAITSETEAQENLNKVESQNPHTKDESSVHNANTNAIEREAQTQEQLAEKIKQTQALIKNQQAWLNTLDPYLNDANYQTSGKKAATNQLRDATNALIDYRRHPEEYDGFDNYARQKKTVNWNRAHKEAQRQGVADSVLQRYDTDAKYDYEESLQALQKERDYRAQSLQEYQKELQILQQQFDAQNQINAAKTKEPKPVDDTPKLQTENGALDEQNAKLKENIALKGQTKDVGTGGTKTTSDVVTSVQPVPAGTVSTEATELDSVRVKIEEVVTAVNTKTAAFTAESAEVQRAVGVENIALNSLKENIETVTTAVKNKTQAFTAEGAEVQRVVDAEINALNNLEQKKTNSSAGNNAPPESVQTQPISVASTEVVELDAIKTKLIEVTSAVNAKTQAFLAEQKAVKSIAQSEVSAMGQVEKSVTAVRVALNNLQTKQHKINLTVAGGEDVANISATETQTLTKLRAALQLTTKRVNEKTQAFNNEKTVVNKVVNSEINALNRLNTRVVEINKTISNLLQNLQSVKAASGNVKIPTPTPSKETQSVKDDSSTDMSSTTKKADPTKADLNSLTKQYEQLGRLQAQFSATGNLKTEQEINSLQRTIELEKNRLGLTREQITALESKRNLANADEQEAIEAEIREKNRLHYAKEEEKARKEAFKSEKQKAQREAMLGKANSAVNRAENTWMGAVGIEGNLSSSFTAEVDNYYQKLDALRRKHEELKSSKLISPEQQKELINQTVEINKMTAEIGELVAEYQKLSGSNVNPENVRSTALLPSDSMDMYKQQLTSYVREITNGQGQIKNFDATTRTLTYTVKTGAHEFTEYTAAVRRADNSLVSVQGSTKRTETFLETTKRKMKEISSYMSGMMLFYRAMSVFRQGIQYIKEIDTALTELKKVTDETEETYSKFLDTAAETAEKVGSTIQKVISSTADWARLGYSMKEAAKFAESTQILMNVSEFTDVSQATDTLISAVQAFEYTAETSMNVVDLLNTIGKQNCRNYIVIYG